MNKAIFVAIAALLVASILVLLDEVKPIHAQVPVGPIPPPISLMVKTDKEVYGANETVIISGTVTMVQPGKPVSIQIYNPTGALYRTNEVNVTPDGSYAFPLKIEGELGIAGQYKVAATYQLNFPSNNAEILFTYLVPYNLIIDDRTYPINYTINWGKLNSISADIEGKSLNVNINATGPGKLTITLPRSIIDATKDNLDASFTIFIGHRHEQFDFQETQSNSDTRTLVIYFPYDEEKPYSIYDIKIVGTRIIPEFPIVWLILIASFVVASVYTRYARRSKYARI